MTGWQFARAGNDLLAADQPKITLGPEVLHCWLVCYM